MTDENLLDVLDDKADYLAYKRAKTIKKLAERSHITLGQIAKLVGHEEFGPIVADIPLQEVIDAQLETRLKEAVAAKLEEIANLKEAEEDAAEDEDDLEEDEDEDDEPPARPARKGVKKKAPVAKKKTTKAPSAKKSVRKRAVAASASADTDDGRKADFGKKKPRLKRDQGYREIIAALKAAGEPCGRGDLEEATGYTGVQVRTFCKELADQGKVEILGKGGRSTKYGLAK